MTGAAACVACKRTSRMPSSSAQLFSSTSMHPSFRLVRLLPLLALAACAAPGPVSYNLGTAPGATSPKPASLTYITGAVDGTRGMPVVISGNVLVPASAELDWAGRFNVNDQAKFAEVMGDELRRLKVFSALEVTSAPKNPQVRIAVIFDRSFHDVGSQSYQLDVTLHIQQGKSLLRKSFHVDTGNGGFWQPAAGSADEGKRRANRALLEVLVPDAEWLAREVAVMPEQLRAANGLGMGRELFAGMRRSTLTAEQGACSWL
eukprot:gene49248-66001_t